MAIKRIRDYKAEYARRVQRGLEKGLTRSQSRGHGNKAKELSSRQRRETEFKSKYGVSSTTYYKVRKDISYERYASKSERALQDDMVKTAFADGATSSQVKHMLAEQKRARDLYRAGDKIAAREVIDDVKAYWFDIFGDFTEYPESLGYYH